MENIKIYDLIGKNELRRLGKQYSSFAKKYDYPVLVVYYDSYDDNPLIQYTITTLDDLNTLNIFTEELYGEIKSTFYKEYSLRKGIYYIIIRVIGDTTLGFADYNYKTGQIDDSMLHEKSIKISKSSITMFDIMVSNKSNDEFKHDKIDCLLPRNSIRQDVSDDPRLSVEALRIYNYINEKIYKNFSKSRIKSWSIDYNLLNRLIEDGLNCNNDKQVNAEDCVQLLSKCDYLLLKEEDNVPKCLVRNYISNVLVSRVLINNTSEKYFELLIDGSNVQIGEFGNYFTITENSTSNNTIKIRITPLGIAYYFHETFEEYDEVRFITYDDRLTSYLIKDSERTGSDIFFIVEKKEVANI